LRFFKQKGFISLGNRPHKFDINKVQNIINFSYGIDWNIEEQDDQVGGGFCGNRDMQHLF
jgi:hypothetical protein